MRWARLPGLAAWHWQHCDMLATVGAALGLLPDQARGYHPTVTAGSRAAGYSAPVTGPGPAAAATPGRPASEAGREVTVGTSGTGNLNAAQCLRLTR